MTVFSPATAATPSVLHPDSYYAASARPLPITEHPPLDGRIDCDVCVVGGGYTGLSAALHLAERGYRVALLEARRIGWGASGRNGGQLGSGQRKDQLELESRFGRDTARRLWALAEEAKALGKRLIARHRIACDLKPGIVTAVHKPALLDGYRAYAEHLQRHYDYPHLQPCSRGQLAAMLGTDAYYGGWLDGDAAHLHPLNYALGLARAAQAAGVALYEHSRVSGYRDGSRLTIRCRHAGDGEVRADYLLLGCNGYLDRLAGPLAGRIMPINNFMLATEPLGEDGARAVLRDDVAVADSRHVVNYFRLSSDRRLLFGGGENYSRRFPRDLKGFVRRRMLKIYPQLATTRIDYAWGGTLAVTMNRLPHFGRLAANVYFAQGYSGHGVALATLAGRLMAEAVAGDAERFDLMASLPTPRFPGGRALRAPGLALGMLYYALRDRL